MRYNVLKSCATQVSPRGPSLALWAIHLVSRLRRQNRLCSSTVSDTANRLLKRTDSEGSSSVAEKKASVVPLFRSGRRSLICARLRNKGKVGVQRGRKTAGCPSSLPPPRARRRSRRPQTANPPLRFSEKLPARQGRTRLRSSSTPVSRCRKRSCPDRANTLAQFGLSQSVQGNDSFPIDTVGIPRYTYN